MSWISKLVETYDNAMAQDEQDRPEAVFHINLNVDMIVRINKQGNFLGAEKITEKYKKPVPVTLDSPGRSGTNFNAHSLTDQLEYVAGDYPGTNSEKKYASYSQTLQRWCDSEYSHPFLTAVWSYVQKKCLMADLSRSGIIEGIPIDKLSHDNVFWEVAAYGCSWEVVALQKLWSDYVLSRADEKDICYVSGEEDIVTSNHPKNINPNTPNAKLISSNDRQNFTYLGRFTDAKQPVLLGYTTSQKAHAALRWLIKRQGFKNDSQTIIVWAIGKEIPKIRLEDLELGEGFAKQMKTHITGDIMVMALDTVTEGRMSITYYGEFPGNSFLDNLAQWQDFNYLLHIPKRKGKGFEQYKGQILYRQSYSAPTFKDLAWLLYGDRQSTIKQRQELILRLLPCLTEKQQIPRDIVRAVIQKASNPFISIPSGNESDFSDKHLFSVSIACALYKGYCIRQNFKEYTMSSESRDYLYGCLLAVAENIENYVLSQILNEHRITNAERFKRRFTNQPYDTWLIIEDRLTPYMNRLQNSSNEKHRKFLFKRKRLLDEIHTRFPGDYRDNSRLSPDYLFGYYTQREQLFSKKTEEVNHDADTQD